jgi:hypothetical protein
MDKVKICGQSEDESGIPILGSFADQGGGKGEVCGYAFDNHRLIYVPSMQTNYVSLDKYLQHITRIQRETL